MSTRARAPSYSSSSSSSVDPPSYPSSLPPDYNPHPSPNEQSVLAGAVPPPDGVFTTRSKYFALALPRQIANTDEDGKEINDGVDRTPVYGRGSIIQGIVELNSSATGFKPQDVQRVTVQIEGKVKLEIAEGGYHSMTFLDHKQDLYPLGDNASATRNTCPNMLPFSYTLPSSYYEAQPAHPGSDQVPPPLKRTLPPSYSVEFGGVPGLRAQVKYTIKIELVRKKLWKRKSLFAVPFNYVPRTRPHVPGPEPTASFLSTLKSSPGEWAVFSSPVPQRSDPTNREPEVPRPKYQGDTITSSLVIPATQTFPVSQTIPFHLQLLLEKADTAPSPKDLDGISKPIGPAKGSTPLTVVSEFRAPHSSTPTAASTARPPVSPNGARSSSFTSPRFEVLPPNAYPLLNQSLSPSTSKTSRQKRPTSANAQSSKPDHGQSETPAPRQHCEPQRTLITLFEDPDCDAGQQVSPQPAINGRTDSSYPPLFGAEIRAPEITGEREPSTAPKKRSKIPAVMKLEKTKDKGQIRVFLQRQIVVTVRGQKVVKTITCGDAKLQRISLDPPSRQQSGLGRHNSMSQSPTQLASTRGQSSSTTSIHQAPTPADIDRNIEPSTSESSDNRDTPPSQGGDGVEYIAWEGFVSPSKEMLSVGGFRASGLWIKDFITLTMVPPDPEHSPLRALHHAVPVRLVTDAWDEEWWEGRRL